MTLLLMWRPAKPGDTPGSVEPDDAPAIDIDAIARAIVINVWTGIKGFASAVVDYVRYIGDEIRNEDADRIVTMQDVQLLAPDDTLKGKKTGSYAKQIRRMRNGHDTGSHPTVDSSSDSPSAGTDTDATDADHAATT